MEGEGTEGEAESDVVEGVGFGGRRELGSRDGDFDLLGHDGAIVDSLGASSFVYWNKYTRV